MPIYKTYIHSIKIKSKTNLPPPPFPCPCVQKQLSNINDNLYRNWNRNAVNKCRFALSLETLQVRESDDGGERDEREKRGRWYSALGCHTERETQQQGTPFFKSRTSWGSCNAAQVPGEARSEQTRPGPLAVGLGESAGSRFSAFQFSVCNPF